MREHFYTIEETDFHMAMRILYQPVDRLFVNVEEIDLHSLYIYGERQDLDYFKTANPLVFAAITKFAREYIMEHLEEIDLP